MVRLFMLWLVCLSILTGALCSACFAGPNKYSLNKPNSSYVLSKKYPRSDIRLDFTVNFKKPGVIFDTVGINAAPIGSWTISISNEGVISVQIYDPTRKSDKKTSNGWHVLSSSYGVFKQRAHHIVVVVAKGIVYLKVGKMPADILALDTPLSGQPVHVGDFPGDNSWGIKYRIHRAMIGTVIVNSFSPITAPAPVVVVNKPTETPTKTEEINTPAPKDDKVKPTAKIVPSDSPEAVNAGVEAIESALAAKDVDKATALTTADARETLGRMFNAHKDELPRIAAILATRKLTIVSGSYAEFEVTEGGKTFTAIFYKIKGQWRLASL
jgi:hypothetical protein